MALDSSRLLRILYPDHSASKLQSPLEQLTHHGKFIIEWSVLRMSATLTMCYGNLCCVRQPRRPQWRFDDKQCRLCWIRWLRSGCCNHLHCISDYLDDLMQLVTLNGACWSHLKTLKHTQTEKRPGRRKYILHKAVLWSLLCMVCTYSVSCVCWILWNEHMHSRKSGSCSIYGLRSIYWCKIFKFLCVT